MKQELYREKIRLTPYHEVGYLIFLFKIYRKKAFGEKEKFIRYVGDIYHLSFAPGKIRECV